MSQKEAIAKAPAGRVRRTPVGRRNVLTVSGQEAGFHYRVVNDVGNNVQRYLNAGYDFVEAKDVTVGDTRIGAPSETGSKAEVHVGGGVKAYVMRIREDWYKEDQEAKQAHVNQLEEATKQKATEGNYGKLEITRD